MNNKTSNNDSYKSNFGLGTKAVVIVLALLLIITMFAGAGSIFAPSPEPVIEAPGQDIQYEYLVESADEVTFD